jgi:predicted nuclease with RNAse H fold
VTLVCGVDVGSFKTPAYVAWLEEDVFELDTYQPTHEHPLPLARQPAVFALDAPQSLPVEGRSRRAADREAKTPTSVLPTARDDVASMRAYGSFVEAGITIFWEAQRRGLAAVPGLTGSGGVLLETYPRFVIRRLWPDLRPIPSKRKAPKTYVAGLWARLRALGLRGPEPQRHDHIDAVLCALAGRSWAVGEAVEVGEPPQMDDGVLREGFIVAPRDAAPAVPIAGVSSLFRAERRGTAP